MNWGDLLTELRAEIDDAGDKPKYPDVLLYKYCREAVADYSQSIPLELADVELVRDTVNPKKFALPADFIEELSVSCPAGRLLEPLRGRLGTKVSTSSRPLFYRAEDKHFLYLNADPGEDKVVLSYKAMHPIPTSETDEDFVFTIPDADMELIALYMEGKLNAKIRNSQSRLDRFKIGAGARTDNPMTEEVRDFFMEYRQKLEERTPHPPITLYRPRRYK